MSSLLLCENRQEPALTQTQPNRLVKGAYAFRNESEESKGNRGLLSANQFVDWAMYADSAYVFSTLIRELDELSFSMCGGGGGGSSGGGGGGGGGGGARSGRNRASSKRAGKKKKSSSSAFASSSSSSSSSSGAPVPNVDKFNKERMARAQLAQIGVPSRPRYVLLPSRMHAAGSR